MKPSSGVALAVAALACFSVRPAAAGKLRLAPYAEYGVAGDDNVFRVADDAQASQRPARGDVIQDATIGVLAKWPMSRQELDVRARASRYRYHRFDRLDHSENDISTALRFNLGHAVSGTARYHRRRRLASFANRNNSRPDFIRRVDPEIAAFLKITPHWRARGRLAALELDHSLANQRRFDRREKQARLAVQYRDGAGSLAAVGAGYIDGEYPQRARGDRLARDFTQTSPFVRLDWAYSGISTLRARIGYTLRANGGGAGADRDFDGVTGRLAYVRELTGKTRLTLGLARQIFSVDNVDANYVRDTRARIRLDWTYSPKLSATAAVSRRWQNYRALSGARRASRRDRVNAVTAELAYQPISVLSLAFHAGYTRRESNRAGADYAALVGGLSVRLGWDLD